MFKKLRKNEKGFTLAELLIVVAIIGVLVAISIPIFTSQLEKAREATDMANIRAAYAEVVADGLTDPAKTHTATVTMKQTKNDWQTSDVNIAGIPIASLNSIAKANATVSIEYTPANGTDDATVKIGGVAVPATSVTSK